MTCSVWFRTKDKHAGQSVILTNLHCVRTAEEISVILEMHSYINTGVTQEQVRRAESDDTVVPYFTKYTRCFYDAHINIIHANLNLCGTREEHEPKFICTMHFSFT